MLWKNGDIALLLFSYCKSHTATTLKLLYLSEAVVKLGKRGNENRIKWFEDCGIYLSVQLLKVQSFLFRSVLR